MSGSLPPIVTPAQLVFGPLTLDSSLKLFNPYDFTLSFKVLSTDPDVFTVRNTSGSLRPRASIEIPISIHDIPRKHTVYKFKVVISDTNQTLLGHKTISAVAGPPGATVGSMNPQGHSNMSSMHNRRGNGGTADGQQGRSVRFAESPAESNASSSGVFADHRNLPQGSPRGGSKSSSGNERRSPRDRSSARGNEGPGLVKFAPVWMGFTVVLFALAPVIKSSDDGERKWDDLLALWMSFVLGMFTMYVQLRLWK